MKNTIAIRREDLSKRGEKRVAVTPTLAKEVVDAGYRLLVQPRTNPVEGTIKRAFPDDLYAQSGASVQEDLSDSKVVFGLKEVELKHILSEKTYLCFSHTHKGQVKNRKLLKAFMDKKNTLIDYELVVNDQGARIITAFTYFAGYAGMIDTLWAAGKRYAQAGISHPISKVPQSIEKEDLSLIKGMLAEIGNEITEYGTPESLPPFITVILGDGKTSTGSQDIYDILPFEEIKVGQLEEVFKNGSLKKVYKCVLDIHEMFDLKEDASINRTKYDAWSINEKRNHYFNHPADFKGNLDEVLPYTTVLMNCILWSPEYPRTMSHAFTRKSWERAQTLQAIGDITCDPNGSIEFSKETWIDNPVYVYDPATGTSTDGFVGSGIAVMAVTNLPCEFSVDASEQFSRDMAPVFAGTLAADFDAATVEESGLPAGIAKAVILWKGELTAPYRYMAEYVAGL